MIYQFYFPASVFITLILFIHILPLNSKPTKSPPKIKLYSYKEADSLSETLVSDPRVFYSSMLTDNLITLNGPVYLVQADVAEMSLACEATFPIMWTFPVPGQLPNEAYQYIDSTESRVSDFHSDEKSPTNTLFVTTIRIKFLKLDFLMLNINCSSVNVQHDMHTSILVTLQGNDILENQGKTVNLQLTRGESFVIPCRASAPSTHPKLQYKQKIILDDSLHKTNSSNWVKGLGLVERFMQYNPRVGFVTNKDIWTFTKLDALPGFIIRCYIVPMENLKEKIYAYFNFTVLDKQSDESSFIFKNNTKGSARITIEQNAIYTRFQCCSGIPDKKPHLTALRCGSRASCRLLEHHLQTNNSVKSDLPRRLLKQGDYDQRDCKTTILMEGTTYVTCKDSNIDFAGKFYQMFKQNSDDFPEYRVTSIQLEFEERHGFESYSLTKHEIERNNTMSVNRKMSIFFGMYAKPGPQKHMHTRTMFPGKHDYSWIWNLDVKDFYANIDFFLGVERLIPRVTVEEYDQDTFYEGEPILFLCVGVKPFFADGAQLNIEWKNGSRKVLPSLEPQSLLTIGEKEVYLSENSQMFLGYGMDTQFAFREPIKADQNMSSVNCWMPVSESTKWETIQKPITVLPSDAPKFLQKENETVYFHYDEMSRILKCTLANGKPEPKLIVLWNGKRVPFHPKNRDGPAFPTANNTLNGTEVNFIKIDHTSQGTLQCIAENVNSTVVRTVHVIVLENSSMTLTLTICVAGVMCVLLVVLMMTKLWCGYGKTKVSICQAITP